MRIQIHIYCIYIHLQIDRSIVRFLDSVSYYPLNYILRSRLRIEDYIEIEVEFHAFSIKYFQGEVLPTKVSSTSQVFSISLTEELCLSLNTIFSTYTKKWKLGTQIILYIRYCSLKKYIPPIPFASIGSF